MLFYDFRGKGRSYFSAEQNEIHFLFYSFEIFFIVIYKLVDDK